MPRLSGWRSRMPWTTAGRDSNGRDSCPHASGASHWIESGKGEAGVPAGPRSADWTYDVGEPSNPASRGGLLIGGPASAPSPGGLIVVVWGIEIRARTDPGQGFHRLTDAPFLGILFIEFVFQRPQVG
jgi:hypothetical protein